MREVKTTGQVDLTQTVNVEISLIELAIIRGVLATESLNSVKEKVTDEFNSTVADALGGETSDSDFLHILYKTAGEVLANHNVKEA